MRLSSYILLSILFLALGTYFGYEAWKALEVQWALGVRWFANYSHSSVYPWFVWVTAGSIVFPLMHRFWNKNIEMTMTFTHELTHTITGLLLFRRIHSFQAEEKGTGVIYSSGSKASHFLVSLAPYCFPIYTIPLLLLRCIILPDKLAIIDVLVGFTLGLHGTCIRTQIGNHQSDINQYPCWFSYLYIVVIWLFMLSLLLITYEPQTTIFLAFRNFGLDIWHYLLICWQYILIAWDYLSSLVLSLFA